MNTRYERLFIETFHGYDGKNMELGKTLGNTTEYDQEAIICGLLAMEVMDEGKRCEYLPKTKRQWERPFLWKNDLRIVLKCSFLSNRPFISGNYVQQIADAFPQWTFKGPAGPTILVLPRHLALQNPNVTVRDLTRSLLFLL